MDVPMYGCMYVGTYSYDQQLVHTVTMNNWFVQSRWTNSSYSYDGQMACWWASEQVSKANQARKQARKQAGKQARK